MKSLARLRCCGGAVLELVCKMELGKFLADIAHSGNVVFVGVREEQVAQVRPFSSDQFENRRGVPAGVEQGGVARKLSSQTR